MVIHDNEVCKTKEIQDYTAGKIEPQHIQKCTRQDS